MSTMRSLGKKQLRCTLCSREAGEDVFHNEVYFYRLTPHTRGPDSRQHHYSCMEKMRAQRRHRYTPRKKVEKKMSPNRAEIVCVLAHGAVRALNEISSTVQRSGPATYQALRQLRASGLVALDDDGYRFIGTPKVMADAIKVLADAYIERKRKE